MINFQPSLFFRKIKRLFFSAIALGVFIFPGCGSDDNQAENQSVLTLVTSADSSSYLLGFILAREAEKNQIVIDPTWLMTGLREGIAGKAGILPDSMMYAYKRALGGKFENGYFRTVFLKASENLKKSGEFLLANKSNEGIAVLPAGVQYKVIKQGAGPVPGISTKVKVFYSAQPLSGKEFANSKTSGGPEIWEIRGLIPGLQQALASMREGSEWELWIPPAMAYDEEGLPGKVAPNEVLHCFLELISLVKDTSSIVVPGANLSPAVQIRPDSNRPKPVLPPRKDSAVSVPKPPARDSG